MHSNINTYISQLQAKEQSLIDSLQQIEDKIKQEEISYSFKKEEAKERATAALSGYEGEGLNINSKKLEKGLPEVINTDILKLITKVQNQ